MLETLVNQSVTKDHAKRWDGPCLPRDPTQQKSGRRCSDSNPLLIH